MPSKRRFSGKNGISIRTVMNACEQLLMERTLKSRERNEYYLVSDFNSQIRYQKAKIPEASLEKETYQHTPILNYSGLEEGRVLEAAKILGQIFVQTLNQNKNRRNRFNSFS